jgi:translation initiation factor 2 subunit 3
MAASPSPLQQSHLNHSDSEGSDSENEAAPSTLTSKLGQLALVEEVEIDVEGLNPLSPEVISKQATINIGE